MSNETESTEAVTATTGDTAAAANADSTQATDAGAGEGQGKAEGESEAQANDKPQEGAPEKYEAFTLPDGYVLEGDRLDAVQEFARANNWTQEKAQASVDEYLKMRTAEMEHQRGAWAVQSEDEFGKDFADISTGAQRALVMAEGLRPGITQRIDATNLGNHPDVLWLFNQLGQHLKPKPMHGMENEASASESRPEKKLWPSMA